MFMAIVLTAVIVSPQTSGESTIDELIRAITPADPEEVDSGTANLVTQSRISASRQNAIFRLASMGDKSSPAIPVLTRLVADPLEPKPYRLAEIEVLRILGQLASLSLDILRQLGNSDDTLIKVAAQRAALFVDPKTQNYHSKQALDDVYRSLLQLSKFEDATLLRHVYEYWQEGDDNVRGVATLEEDDQDQSNPNFQVIARIVFENENAGLLIAELFSTHCGVKLGQRLMNHPVIKNSDDFRQMILKQAFEKNAPTDAAKMPASAVIGLLDSRGPFFDGERSSTNRRMLGLRMLAITQSRSTYEDFLKVDSLDPEVWQGVFDAYVTYMRFAETDPMAIAFAVYLREIDRWPDANAKVAFHWLLKRGAAEGTSPELRAETLKTVLHIASSTGSGIELFLAPDSLHGVRSLLSRYERTEDDFQKLPLLSGQPNHVTKDIALDFLLRTAPNCNLLIQGSVDRALQYPPSDNTLLDANLSPEVWRRIRNSSNLQGPIRLLTWTVDDWIDEGSRMRFSVLPDSRGNRLIVKFHAFDFIAALEWNAEESVLYLVPIHALGLLKLVFPENTPIPFEVRGDASWKFNLLENRRLGVQLKRIDADHITVTFESGIEWSLVGSAATTSRDAEHSVRTDDRTERAK
ncbi:hypothetical protein [Aureliella helgolandensis]|uniref:Uncharacterized protein n=1 Tax=Aureliella helgolandensis TaxID=2527968 RepID=A0A518G9N6_9BACT|nr:hypothetical protein [Aureliella helgolandensis]QDV25289.1 hypothetical protein Q31a_36130 [Aureliella helgolandensis]